MRLPVSHICLWLIPLVICLAVCSVGTAAAQGLQFESEDGPSGDVEIVPDAATGADPDDGRALSGDDAASVISGNTLMGWRNGSPFTEFYGEDGTVRGVSNNAFYTGLWSVDGNMFCIDYEFGDITDYDGCATSVVPRNGEFVFEDDDGTEIQTYEFAAGNPAEL